jgi:hypothetical protein
MKVMDAYASIPIRLLDPPLRQAMELCGDLNIDVLEVPGM